MLDDYQLSQDQPPKLDITNTTQEMFYSLTLLRDHGYSWTNPLFEEVAAVIQRSAGTLEPGVKLMTDAFVVD